jgi:topoisomerase-4 subunit A
MIADRISQKGLGKFEDLIDEREKDGNWRKIKLGLGILNLEESLYSTAITSADIVKYSSNKSITEEQVIKALSILDEVIHTIRSSKNKSDAENNLVINFGFTPAQAEAIVVLQLYRLTNTDVTALEDELKNLTIIIKGLNKILEDKEVLMKQIKDELKKVSEEYSNPRLTEVKESVTEIKIDTTALITKEDVPQNG